MKLYRVRWEETDAETGEFTGELSVRLSASPAAGKDIDELVLEVVRLERLGKVVSDALEDIRFEVQKRMEEAEATEYVGKGGTARLRERAASYDADALDAVLEHIDEEELLEKGALIAATTRVVPRRWNASKLKPFGRRGKAIRKIIEGARQLRGYSLEVKPPK